MSQAIQTTSNNVPATQSNTPDTALKTDVLVPKLLLMQGLSKFVAARTAQQGDIVRSTTGQKIGDDKKPIEFIPLTMQNAWIVKEEVNGKFEFRGIKPRLALVHPNDIAVEADSPEPEKRSENLAWEFTHNGTKWKRVKVINVYALLPGDISAFSAEVARAAKAGDMPDIEKVLMPVVVSFQGKSFQAGRAVATHFTKAAAMAQYGAKAHGFAMTLSCRQETNNKGTFFVYDVGGSRKASKEEFAEASKWESIVKGGAVQVHEVDEDEAAPVDSNQF